MKAYLKKYGVWEIVINVAAPTNKKSKAANQKEANKNNAIALKFLLDGLPTSIKESLGEFTSARALWLKLEEDHQGKMQGKQLEEEEQEQNTHEYKGMNFEYHSDLFDKIDNAIIDYTKDLAIAKKNVEEVLTTCHTDSYDNASISSPDFRKLKKYSTTTYQWYQRKTTMLSNLLKELKGECITLRRQHDVQDVEIDRLQEENNYLER